MSDATTHFLASIIHDGSNVRPWALLIVTPSVRLQTFFRTRLEAMNHLHTLMTTELGK